MAADFRAHPDYAEGYETAFCCDPPKPNASPEYEAGYEAATDFVEALKAAGFKARTPGKFSLSLTIGPFSRLSFDLEEEDGDA